MFKHILLLNVCLEIGILSKYLIWDKNINRVVKVFIIYNYIEKVEYIVTAILKY